MAETDPARGLTPAERCGVAGAIAFVLVSLFFILTASPDAGRGPRAPVAARATVAGAAR